MLINIEAKKLNMSQVFTPEGRVVPVTYLKINQEIDQNLMGQPIELTGTSKGRGFAGVMKKWNFGGQQATRGQSDKPRAAGSIGAQTPSKVFKGKKMAGRMGNNKVTIKSSRIMLIDNEKSLIAVSGPVPGARNSKVLLKFEQSETNES